MTDGLGLLAQVRSLMSEGKGDRVIAETLDITRHQARCLIKEVELADAKQGVVRAVMPDVLSNDADAWALLINGAFRRSYESTIEAGRLLIAAKEKLAPHGTWLPMLETKLDFSPDTAQRLMAIARDERLTNTAHVRFLPRSYSTLHALTKLTDEEFARGIEEKIIRPDMERKDVEIIRPTPRRADGSDGSGSPVEIIRDPAAVSVQQGLATPVTDIIRDDGNVAKPEATSGESCPHVPPGPSEATHMPGGGLAIVHNRVEPSDSLDFFPTPPWATRALMERVLVHLDRTGSVKFQTAKDPACGEGHMSEVLKEYFLKVISTDIKDYGYGDAVADFLDPADNPEYDADWIITNPPFGDNTDKFILKALQQASYGVAMLVRLQCLETVGRYERIYKNTPPSLIAFFAERVPMHKGRWVFDGDTMTAYVWLVWIKGMSPQAPFWIPPGCRVALTRPDDAARFKADFDEAPASEAAE